MKENIGQARDYAKTDSGNSSFNWVLCRTAGSLVIEGQLGATHTITDAPADTWIPVGNAIRIKTASTAAGLIVF